MHVYAERLLAERLLVQAIESDNIQTRTQYGLFDELYMNFGSCEDETVAEPVLRTRRFARR
jgi:hypothetical protein